MSAHGEFAVSNGHSNVNGNVPHNSYSAAHSPEADDAPIAEEHTSATGTPIKFVPLMQLYNATSEDSSGNGNSNGSTKGGSRKGKSRKLDGSHNAKCKESLNLKPPVLIYTRRNKNGHMTAASTPAPSFHERLLKRAKLFPTGAECHEDSTVVVAETECEKIKQLQDGIIKIGASVDNGEILSANDGSVDEGGFCNPNGESVKESIDNSLVHCKGTGVGVSQGNVESASVDSSVPGLNSVFTPDSEDREGIGKPEEKNPAESVNGSVVPPGGAYAGRLVIKKPQKKRKFEGVDLIADKRIRWNDFGRGPWLRESRARKQRAAKVSLGRNSQTVKPAETLHACTWNLATPKIIPSTASSKKRWIEVSFIGAEPMALLGCKCKVYWPMDDDWYAGVIDKFDPEKNQHHVQYVDGEEEWLLLAGEKIKLYLSRDEMSNLNLKDKEQEMISEMKKLDYDEMAALAAELDDYQEELGHGDLIWAKITGHPMWPAFVMDEAHANACNGLESAPREGSIPVQFFGSYDYARIGSKQIFPFSRGLEADYHLKCKRMLFLRGLEEADRYLKERKLPEEMAKLQNIVAKPGCQTENDDELEISDAGEDCMGDERSEKIKKSVECLFTCPIDIGALRVLSLGKIVKDSEHFHNEHHIWTQGYTAIRKFSSIKDPGTFTEYKMEVLKNPLARNLPLFRVTLDDGEQIDGPTPTACWKKIYPRLEKAKQKPGNDLNAHMERKRQYRSGPYMFGFANRRIAELIQALPHARACSKFTDWIDKSAVAKSEEVLPAGYRPVQVQWKDLDRCSVCHMEEEYVNNLFLQCDKCRMMVHANCYGEREPLDGELWLCNLCRPGAPKKCPPCCLCPITGGAMKRTTDGRWAHLTCAMWIPETCLVDIKRMEPIDGLNRISKDRWKLICSICEVPYGACIQCSDHSCRVAYHPLCARAAGLCVEVQEEKNVRHGGIVDEECEQHLRLLSFCKKHRQPTDEQIPIDHQRSFAHRDCSSYIPPPNSSGCARCEPYNFAARRGRKEPEALVAASIKRLFVENRPYLVSGYRRNGTWAERQFNDQTGLKSNHGKDPYLLELESTHLSSSEHQLEGRRSFLSMSEKYEHMRATFRKRLAFGKSGIHGFGIFAKQAHKGGDMVIEYTGEIVRPTIADIREHFIYNSLVGAGTYLFRIDEERVIDATRAGSIAHLINHSCEPNCYSRVISVRGEEHIIIFAKRDIKQWEELTYDYRFFSIDEQLSCYCGFPRCRGIVNVNDTEEQVGKICVPCSELIDWRPDNVK